MKRKASDLGNEEQPQAQKNQPKKKTTGTNEAVFIDKDGAALRPPLVAKQSNVARARWSQLIKKICNRGGNLPELSGLNIFTSTVKSEVYEKTADDRVLLRLAARFTSVTPFDSITVLLPRIRISQDTLTGFDNTGNVRLWPGGEALAAWILQRPDIVRDKKVLELGSGLMGLPSLIASRSAEEVMITDGNSESVTNVQKNLEMNPEAYSNVKTKQMIWTDEGSQLYDVILAADCVFFREHHRSLLDSFYANLKEDGIVLVCSPERKGSLKVFRENLEKDGRFVVVVDQEFDKFLEPLIKQVVESDVADLLVPKLMVLKKLK